MTAAAAAAAAAGLLGSAHPVGFAQGGTQAHVAHPIIGAHAQVDLLQQLWLLHCTAMISLGLAVPVSWWLQRKPGFCIALPVSAVMAVIWSGGGYSAPDRINRHLQASEGQSCVQACNIMVCHVKKNLLGKIRLLYNWLFGS